MRVTVGDSGLCCCVYVASFKRQLTPLWVDSSPQIYLCRLCIVALSGVGGAEGCVLYWYEYFGQF